MSEACVLPIVSQMQRDTVACLNFLSSLYLPREINRWWQPCILIEHLVWAILASKLIASSMDRWNIPGSSQVGL